MVNNKELYKIWAPFDLAWSPWARPVIFENINDSFKTNKCLSFEQNIVKYVGKGTTDTAIFVDMPAAEGIEEGIALAKLGFRPVPLYNGTEAQDKVESIIDNTEIKWAIIWGAKELKNIELDKSAPPAFLLDSNRIERWREDVSVFDNSWDIYYQDVPTAEYLLKNGIKKIILRSLILNRDLKRILRGYQKKGIQIYWAKEDDKIKKIKILKAPKERD